MGGGDLGYFGNILGGKGKGKGRSNASSMGSVSRAKLIQRQTGIVNPFPQLMFTVRPVNRRRGGKRTWGHWKNLGVVVPIKIEANESDIGWEKGEREKNLFQSLLSEGGKGGKKRGGPHSL